MSAPGSFILFAVPLFLLLWATMAVGLVLLYAGWRKRSRLVQFLASIPIGLGLFIVGPLLILDVIMLLLWFNADWPEIDVPPNPPAVQVQSR